MTQVCFPCPPNMLDRVRAPCVAVSKPSRRRRAPLAKVRMPLLAAERASPGHLLGGRELGAAVGLDARALTRAAPELLRRGSTLHPTGRSAQPAPLQATAGPHPTPPRHPPTTADAAVDGARPLWSLLRTHSSWCTSRLIDLCNCDPYTLPSGVNHSTLGGWYHCRYAKCWSSDQLTEWASA